MNIRNVKVIFAGDGAVGKTAIVNKFTKGEYGDTYKMTIGTNFSVHKSEKNDTKLQLICWDLGGQPRFEVVRAQFYTGAKIIVLVYDITSSGSFKNLANWLEEVNRASNAPYKGIVIGNKTDFADYRVVDIEEAKSFAEAIGFGFLETSAKDGTGIPELVQMLTDCVLMHPSQKLMELEALS